MFGNRASDDDLLGCSKERDRLLDSTECSCVYVTPLWVSGSTVGMPLHKDALLVQITLLSVANMCNAELAVFLSSNGLCRLRLKISRLAVVERRLLSTGGTNRELCII